MRARLTSLLLALLLAGTAWGVPAVQVEQNLVLSEDPLPFGKPAELVLTLSWEKGAEFTPPEADQLIVPEARMLDAYMVSGGGAGKSQVQYHLIFTRFEPGEFSVGPVVIPTKNGIVESKAQLMKFAGAQVMEGDKKGEIRAIKPVVELSTADFWKRLGAQIAGSLSILILLLALLNYTRVLDRFRSPKSRALRRLKRAVRRSSKPDDLLLESVDTLRDYLSSAYGLAARSSTSGEIVRGITMDNRCKEWKALTEEMLTRADRVKFAQKQVGAEEVADLVSRLVARLRDEKGGKRA